MKLMLSLLADDYFKTLEEKIIDIDLDFNKIVQSKALSALSEIQQCLKEYDLIGQNSDFETLEKIVTIFEKYNLDFSPCHDF